MDVCRAMMGRGVSGEREGDFDSQRRRRWDVVLLGDDEREVKRSSWPEDLKSRNAWWANDPGARSKLSTMTMRGPGGPRVRSLY